jgi:16S rRNA processing protein RimM
MSEQETQSLNLVNIAQISGVYGVRGQLKIRSYTDPKTSILKYKSLYWNYHGNWQLMPLVKNSVQVIGNSIVISIEACSDRDLAKQYLKTDIAVKRADFPKLKSNEYYWTDLEGLAVYTTYHNTHQYLGKIDYLMETGSNDVLVVKSDDGNKEYLIPYVLNTYVLSVDLIEQQIIVDWDPDF